MRMQITLKPARQAEIDSCIAQARPPRRACFADIFHKSGVPLRDLFSHKGRIAGASA